MQYMLLIYEDETIFGDDKNNPALVEIERRHREFAGSLGATLVSGAGLKQTSAATSVRTAGGKQAIHDGPFAETKEQLGGYYLIDAPDLDAAIAIARQVPMTADGAVEIRPLLSNDGGAA